MLATRAFEGLKAVLGRRLCDEGPVDILEAAPQRALSVLAQLLGDLAQAGVLQPTIENKQLVRANLLEIAAVALRCVQAIDQYDLATYYKEQDALAGRDQA